ncbi:hypothetical protein [Noviherbaspirillum saxi]|uniref:Uncharacterized protein n=1 Tax=Noviherbaspirillum saxi TaxID=2320863 RepID=A0A3A3FJ55_9BURK|nr:hypothetical protein [Noviherbaspirillum saxi]RJF95284.1 hypothetical protein D3871_17775 [Noviherbaspirillum saxi]
MSRENDVSALLQQYAAETGVRSVQKVEQDFVEVAQQVTAETITHGLSEAILSDQTPPFGEMVGQSFERGDTQQRTGVLRELLDGAGPAAAQPLVDNGVLSSTPSNDEPAIFVDPAMVAQLQPSLVEQMADEAMQEDPSVIERMSSLYAEDPELGKTLGGVTLSVALGKMAEKR